MFRRLFFSQGQTRLCRRWLSQRRSELSNTRRRLGVEPTEERAFLSIVNVSLGRADYCVAEPAQNAPIKPTPLDVFKDEIESTTTNPHNELVFKLVDVFKVVLVDETDEDDGFIGILGKKVD